MNFQKRIASSPVLFSCAGGYSYYFYEPETHLVFGKPKKLIRHIKMDELFYITPFPGQLRPENNLEYWISMIQSPANLDNYIWPVDIIALEDGEHYALVFPLRAIAVYEPITSALENDANLDWENIWVKQIAGNLLDAWERFDVSSYAYHEFSADNMYYQREKYQVLFDFSFSAHKTSGVYDSQSVIAANIMPDYADPYYIAGRSGAAMDRASDYYSMAAILFKFMIGRLPYHGSILDDVPDNSESEHETWLKIYHSNPVFIFDDYDTRNKIGSSIDFAHEAVFAQRWERLPTLLRDMFHNTFTGQNALRDADELTYYTPAQWKAAIEGTLAGVRRLSRAAAAGEQEMPAPAQKPKKPSAGSASPAQPKREPATPLKPSAQMKPEPATPVIPPARSKPEPTAPSKATAQPKPKPRPQKKADETRIDLTSSQKLRTQEHTETEAEAAVRAIYEHGMAIIDEEAAAKREQISRLLDVLTQHFIMQVISAPAQSAEPTAYNVILAETGRMKIGVIHVIRGLTELKLADAKALSEDNPKTVFRGLSPELAQRVKAHFEAAGAKITLAPARELDEELDKATARLADRYDAVLRARREET